MWNLLLAAIERLAVQQHRIYQLELRVAELEQSLRGARGV